MVTERPAAPSWLEEIEADAGPPFHRMGTRALPGGWTLGGDDVDHLLAEKQRVLAEHHDEAFAALSGTEAAAGELLAELLSGRAADGEPPADCGPPGLHPLDTAGRLVPEDLCLLARRDGEEDGGRGDRRGRRDGRSGGWFLAAGSVCFPSHWRLVEKLGRPVAEVHAPVPLYRVELAGRVDRFLDRLRPGSDAWRRNWTVHTNPELFAPVPPPPPDPPVTAADVAERLWLRSERQTLRRLPRSGAIVFGIRTQQVPLGALAERPELCRRLARAAATWPPALVAYRGGEAVRRPLVAWLRRAVAGAPG